MRTLLTYLPALACGAMVLVCARMMFGSRGHQGADEKSQEIAKLQEEVARLRAEIESPKEEERIDG